MKRTHWMTAAAAAFAMATFAPAAWTAPTPDSKSPLAAVPASAPLVIHLNSPEALRDHVVAFLKNAVPDRAEMVEKQANEFLKNGAEGRKLRGLAKDGSVFVVFTEMPKDIGPDKPPKVAVVASITSYSDFRDNILTDKEKKSLKQGDGFESATSENGNQPVFFVDKKDYVVVTPVKDVAVAFAKGAPGLDGKMSKEQAAKFLASDAGVYLSMDVFNKEYADQIKAARKAAEEQMKTLEDTVGKTQKAQFEMIRKVLPQIFQAVEDSKGALATIEVRPGGVSIHTESEMRTGTPTADALKGAKGSAFKDLGKLPAGDVFYSGMEIDPAMLRFTGTMLSGLTTDPDAKGAKALAEAFEGWTKAGPTEVLGAVTYPIAGVSVTKADNPDKLVAASLKMLEAMGTEGGFQGMAYLKDKPEIKPNAQKYKDVSYTSVHMVWDFEKMFAQTGAAPGLPEEARKKMAEAMKKMMGEDMTVFIGVDGKNVNQVTAKDWDSAQKLLDQYSKGENTVGDDKTFAAARKELPEQASVLCLIDAVQYTGVMLDFMKPILESSGAPVPDKFPKPIKGKPGFVGFAITLAPDSGAFDLSVTSEAVKQIYQGYVSPLLPKD